MRTKKKVEWIIIQVLISIKYRWAIILNVKWNLTQLVMHVTSICGYESVNGMLHRVAIALLFKLLKCYESLVTQTVYMCIWLINIVCGLEFMSCIDHILLSMCSQNTFNNRMQKGCVTCTEYRHIRSFWTKWQFLLR
jgi:hypothetical protein